MRWTPPRSRPWLAKSVRRRAPRVYADRGVGNRAATQAWDGTTLGARIARAALLPLSAAYGAVTGVRRWAYDRALLPISTPDIPVIAIGNLTVGGTGKTPIAAWV